jgi:CHAT domain-containing protein
LDRDLKCACSQGKSKAESQDESATSLLQELHRVLIAPVEEQLTGAEELLIVPHKELSEVPWAALMDGKESYLIER